MEPETYARWLQSKLHEAFDPPSDDNPPRELEELAKLAAEAVENRKNEQEG